MELIFYSQGPGGPEESLKQPIQAPISGGVEDRSRNLPALLEKNREDVENVTSTGDLE